MPNGRLGVVRNVRNVVNRKVCKKKISRDPAACFERRHSTNPRRRRFIASPARRFLPVPVPVALRLSRRCRCSRRCSRPNGGRAPCVRYDSPTTLSTCPWSSTCSDCCGNILPEKHRVMRVNRRDRKQCSEKPRSKRCTFTGSSSLKRARV